MCRVPAEGNQVIAVAPAIGEGKLCGTGRGGTRWFPPAYVSRLCTATAR